MRWLAYACTALSVLLLGATLLLWSVCRVRSYYAVYEPDVEWVKRDYIFLSSRDGAMLVTQIPRYPPGWSAGRRTTTLPPWPMAAFLVQRMGPIQYERTTDRYGYFGGPLEQLCLLVRYWALAALFAIGPLIHLLVYLARRRRRRPGHCPACGYDLRATPERCPECGALIPSTKLSPSLSARHLG